MNPATRRAGGLAGYEARRIVPLAGWLAGTARGRQWIRGFMRCLLEGWAARASIARMAALEKLYRAGDSATNAARFEERYPCSRAMPRSLGPFG